jgi:hypothetical protein
MKYETVINNKSDGCNEIKENDEISSIVKLWMIDNENEMSNSQIEWRWFRAVRVEIRISLRGVVDFGLIKRMNKLSLIGTHKLEMNWKP